MGDVEKLREEEEMEEGEASESDEDVEVNVTLPTEKFFHNNNGIPYGPDPVTKQSFFSGFTTDAKEKPCELDEPSSVHSPSSLSVKLLYKSLDLGPDDFQGGYWKSDTLHMWSAESMDAAAIMYYLRNFGPSSIHWTSHNECNVHWKDTCGPIKALLGMSCPIQCGEDPLLPAGSHQPPSPPRPPTRRHSTPQEALGETSDKQDNQSKKKNKKKKMKKSESSGNSESSSSDSDDSSSSSSDSSSSDSDSSDSDSDDSSSDSDSSSSSSSSSSSDSDSSSSRKVKAKKRKKLAKAASKRAGEMEVDDASQKMEGPAVKTEVDVSNEVSVKLSDIPAGCALPKGRWRLGLPCPQSRVLLFRFANSDDIDKAHQMKRKLHAPDDDRKGGVWGMYDEEKRQRKKKRRRESDEEEDDEKTGLHMGRDEERRRRRARRTYEAGVKARLSGPKLGLPIMRPPSAALSLYHPPRPDAFPPPLVPAAAAAAEGMYRDLDDPGVQPEDSKNPWGSLAQNWGKKETSCLDYQALLKNHRKAATTGQKRKRDHDEDSGYDGARRNRRDGGYAHPGPDSHRRVDDHHRYPDSGGEDRQRSDEEEDGSSESDASDDVVAWNSKMRYPRMKMYADVEEKRRKVKPKRHKPVSDGAQWDPRGRDAAEGPPRKAKSIFSRLGGGDVPHPRTSVNKFREREFIAPEDREWGAERPVKRSRVTSSPAREAVGGMRSEVHVARARDVKSRLGGGRRY